MQREELLNIIKPVAAFAAGKSCQVEAYQTICFRGGFAQAYNGEAGLAIACPLPIDGLVSATKMSAILGKFSSDEIKVVGDGNNVQLKCGRSKLTLGLQSSHTFPNFLPSQFVDLAVPANLQAAIASVVRFVDVVAGNKFPGVLVSGDYVYSTDGARCTRYSLDAKINGKFYLPLSAARRVMKSFAPTRLIAWGSMLGGCFPEPSGMWCSATLSGSFPDKLIDGMFSVPPIEQHLVNIPAELEESIDRMLIIAGRDGIDVISEGGTIYLATRTLSGEELTESAPWECQHEFRFRTKSQHFRDAITLGKRLDISPFVRNETPNYLRFYGERVEHCLALGV